MEIIIKPYTDFYKNEVIALILDIQRNEFDIPVTLQAQPDLNEIPTFYQRDKGNFWIALANNTVVGTIALLNIKNNEGALRKMFVNNLYRGKEFGVGQKLLSVLLTWSKAHQFNAIYLGTTEKFLAAHRFYEKNGFIEIAKALLPDNFPIMNVDVKFYTLGLE